MRQLLLTFLGILFAHAMALAQTRQLTGVVKDAGSGEPVLATIKIQGTSTGTVTDFDGNFAMKVSNTPLVLEVSSTGYKATEVNVDEKMTNIVINLEVSSVEISEVVVTALGIRKEKKALGYAITEVSGEDLTQARTNNVMNNLVGKVAGLNVVSTATGAGGSSRVVLRGNTSLSGGNQPLYVVDGIPIDNSNRGSAGEWGGRDAGDGIQMLNPDEIESISVLKGGAAAALYGSRASNGVILVTTKRGKQSKGLGIEINSNFTTESVMDLTEWQYEYGHGVDGQKPADQATAASINLNSWGAKMDGSSVPQFDGVSRPYSAQKNNVKDFYQTGTNLNNSITFNGGSDKFRYNVMASDLNNQSVIPGSTLHRNNFAANVGMTPTTKLSVNFSGRYILEKVKNRPRLSDSPGNANFTIGILPTSLNQQTFKDSKLNANGGENVFNGNPYVTNPYWAIEDFQQEDSRKRFIGNMEARYNFTDWLYLRGRLGADQYTRSNFEVTPTGTAYAPGGQINDQSKNQFNERNAEVILGVNKMTQSNFGIDMFVGGNAMKQVEETNGYGGDNFFVPGFYNINNLQNKWTNYDYNEKRINSMFGSAEFSYNRMLYVTVTGRNDWYSTLSPDNWSLFYPSASASFIISEATQMPDFVSFLKLRGGWSKLGGDRDPYGLTLNYGLGSNTFNGLPVGSIATNTIPNKNLKPYQMVSSEIGLDARLFHNQVGLDLTFYTRTTTDDIISSQISQTSGYGSVLINIGEVSNKGVELLLNLTPFKSKSFTWDLSYNMGYNKNEVVTISDQLETSRIANARSLTAFVDHIVGKPFGQVMGYDYKRNASGELLLKDGLPQRGELLSYGTGVSPLTLGLNNDFRFGNFNFSFLIDGRFGGHMYSGTNDFGTYRGKTERTLEGREGGIVVDGIDETTGEKNTTNVSAQSYNQSIGLNISSEFIYKSDFIKLRQIIFGYTLPSTLFGEKGIRGASISLVGRNLLILKKYVPNIDPESTYNSGNGQGLEWFGAPPVRTFGVNLNLRF
ncbi:MAG: SusC/RagA family TonB-linked outer membrane protein [Saprospiraceae bacterium]|nr:SusC/RagA family TonB-linked outer membrane protein [Saprospiraceae bacterium]